MRIGEIYRLRREDFTDAPAWTVAIFDAINRQNEAFYKALSGALTFGDNILAHRKSFNVLSDELPLKFSNPLTNRPLAIILCGVHPKSDPTGLIGATLGAFEWSSDVSTITIDIQGLTVATVYSIELLIIGA